MKTIVFSSPQMSENTYLCIDENTRECVVVDPGSESSRVIDHLAKESLILTDILLTHGHYDHIEGLPMLVEAACVLVVAHLDEAPVLENGSVNLSAYMAEHSVEIQADVFLRDRQQLRFGDTVFTIIHTPGHTPGGVCYYCEADGIVFTGDTLFYHSIGRTDLPLGDQETLIASIRDRLFSLPGSVRVFPGHGQPTDIAHEKKYNPYVDA